MISFIIPLYNIPNLYLDRCLKSFFSQKEINECEIIVVNDASQLKENDVLCNEYKKHKNFTYIKLEKNSGVSTARFIGLAHAKKDFCCFLDSDDFINSNSLKIIIEVIKKESNKFDIWKGIEKYVDGETLKTLWQWSNNIKEFYSKSLNPIRFYENSMIGGKILKTNIAKDVSMFSQRVQNHEDLFFILCYLSKIKYERLGKINFELFTKCKRKNSAEFNPNIYEKCISFLWFMDMFYLYRINLENSFIFFRKKKDKQLSFEMSKIIECFFKDIWKLYENFYKTEKRKVNKFWKMSKKKIKKYGVKIPKNLRFKIINIKTNTKMLVYIKKIIKFIFKKLNIKWTL